MHLVDETGDCGSVKRQPRRQGGDETTAGEATHYGKAEEQQGLSYAREELSGGPAGIAR